MAPKVGFKRAPSKRRATTKRDTKRGHAHRSLFASITELAKREGVDARHVLLAIMRAFSTRELAALSLYLAFDAEADANDDETRRAAARLLAADGEELVALGARVHRQIEGQIVMASERALRSSLPEVDALLKAAKLFADRRSRGLLEEIGLLFVRAGEGDAGALGTLNRIHDAARGNSASRYVIAVELCDDYLAGRRVSLEPIPHRAVELAIALSRRIDGRFGTVDAVNVIGEETPHARDGHALAAKLFARCLKEGSERRISHLISVAASKALTRKTRAAQEERARHASKLSPVG